MKVTPNHRLHGESFKHYRTRLNNERRVIDLRLKYGRRLLWNSTLNGTYTIANHGVL